MFPGFVMERAPDMQHQDSGNGTFEKASSPLLTLA